MIPELAADTLEPEAVEELADELAPNAWQELDARRAMIALGQTKLELDRVKTLKAAVAESYDNRIRALVATIDRLRRNLTFHVETHGPLNFPDVGTAALTTVNKGGRVKVVDATPLPEAVKREVVKVEVDPEAFEAWTKTLEPRTITSTDGDDVQYVLVDPATGELVDGLEYLPEMKTLRAAV